jgi:integrase
MQSAKTVRRRLADGSVKTYTYERHRPRAWTLGRVIEAYKQSAAFTRLKPTTRRQYARLLNVLAPLDAVAVADIRRRNIRAIRDALAQTPAMANEVVKVARVVLAFALDEELIEFNPLVGLKPLAIGEHAPWPDAAIAAIPELPAYIRRAAMLALYTGQRQSDVIRMTWADYDGSAIRVVQGKTGARLWVPCHSALREALDGYERQAVTICTTARGRPWATPGTFATMFGLSAAKILAMRGVVFHGLRKTAALRLAEAGCSTHEIAAVTGHASLAMIQHYTKGADQKRCASAAIVKLEGRSA